MELKNKIYVEDLDTAISQVIDIEKLGGHSLLITGASGLIGSFLVDMCMRWNQSCQDQQKILVYATGRNQNHLQERFSEYVGHPFFIMVPYDVNQPISFDFPVDYMIHAASNAYPAVFQKDPVGTVMSNVQGTYQLLEYCKMHQTKRFLFISTGEVYGQGDVDLEAFDESYSGYVDLSSPRSCYPSSKRAAENLCVSYSAQYGVDTVIVRPSHTYGPNTTKTDNRANVQFVNDVINNRDIVMKSAGAQMRSYTYIADAASAILTVLLNGENANAYNIANPEARVTIAEFAKILAKLSGKKVIFEQPDEVEKAQLTPIAKAVLASEKLERLGFKGSYSVEKGLSHILAILKA